MGSDPFGDGGGAASSRRRPSQQRTAVKWDHHAYTTILPSSKIPFSNFSFFSAVAPNIAQDLRCLLSVSIRASRLPSLLHHDVNKPEQSKTCGHDARHVDHHPYARFVHRHFMDEMVSHTQTDSYHSPPSFVLNGSARCPLASVALQGAGPFQEAITQGMLMIGKPISDSQNNLCRGRMERPSCPFSVSPSALGGPDFQSHFTSCRECSCRIFQTWGAQPIRAGRARRVHSSRKTAALEPLDECSFVQRNHLTFVRVRATSVPTASFVTSAIFPRSRMSTTTTFSTARSLARSPPHFCDRPSSSPLTSQEFRPGH